MVALDATFLLLLLDENAGVPIDPATGKAVEKCRERVDLLIANLAAAKTRVCVPTPALAECLVTLADRKQSVLQALTGSYGFRIEPFDIPAAVEVADMTEQDGAAGIKPTPLLTKAKLKYDRQIVAIAKTRGIKTIFTDDDGLCARAKRSGLVPVKLAELPCPAEPPQGKLDLPEPAADPGSVQQDGRAAETVAEPSAGTAPQQAASTDDGPRKRPETQPETQAAAVAQTERARTAANDGEGPPAGAAGSPPAKPSGEARGIAEARSATTDAPPDAR